MDNGNILALAVVVLVLVAFIALCMVPVSMAKKRGRSKLGWFLFSFFLSPLLGMIFLACLGETEERRRERLLEEEELRLDFGRRHAYNYDNRPLNSSGRT